VLNNAKVLIVEDEETLAENIMARLQRSGADVRVAFNGKQAIATARIFAPQIVLLDYQLPDMDGFEILDTIRVDDPACACVLMTGHPLETLAADAQQRGIEYLLAKPFSLAEVESRLVAALGKTPGLASSLAAERRQTSERRAPACAIVITVLLSDGTLLTQDRRVSSRRG
jgi:DNA-binding response OmpR family regulator